MVTDGIAEATRRQNNASRPERAVWVSANAGSGKTRVLTDRVARLLLNRQLPQNILCLTYTKAAAAEMQTRLFKRLGEWSMLPDDALRAALTGIGERGEHYDAARLAHTRTHFARALETPGGLKIQTIHAFCASLLRQFPIEAGVSPQFREMDDGQSALLRAQVLDEIATEAPERFIRLARHITDEQGLNGFLREVVANRDDFTGFDRDAAARTFGIAPDLTAQKVAEDLQPAVMALVSDALLAQLAKAETQNETKALPGLKSAANDPASVAHGALEVAFLTLTGKPKVQGLPSSDTKKNAPAVAEAVEGIKALVFAARQDLNAIAVLNKTADLHAFAEEFIARYETFKAERGFLEFDDLIDRTRDLLSVRDTRDWVLFRLDQRIDHILVDEAQDTSPKQWDIISTLSAEFSNTEATGRGNRTLFVVGDEKQSIFGFQGADPQKFGFMRDRFAEQFSPTAQGFDVIELPMSFRSAKPVLELVDTVFAQTQSAMGSVPRHDYLPDKPGRVDLWDFIGQDEKPEKPKWFEPVDTIPETDAVLKLARKTAATIAKMIADGVVIGTKSGQRPVRPEDFLVLVRSRSRYFHALIEALRVEGVPVAGADRMKIAEELAVKDLISLMRFLDNQTDDLSLAEVLRSPVFGLTEAEVFHLAHGREGTLWAALRQSAHSKVVAVIDDLLKRVDFERPYEILERVLIAFGARSRFLARLQPGCEDAIDELLAQTLDYESGQAPSLAGFLHWFTVRDTEIKRDMEAGKSQVRVMTVHGAKGLEAPVVILPDTAQFEAHKNKPALADLDGQPVWTAKQDDSPDALGALEDDRREAATREYLRLLYVALTRAENWLIVCGAGKHKKTDTGRWYERVKAAMEAMGAAALPEGGLTLTHEWTDTSSPRIGKGHATGPLPDWATTPPPPSRDAPKPLSPSQLAEPHVLAGELGEDGLLRDAAMMRGTLIHRLLEVLPTRDRPDWPAIAERLVPDPFDPADLLAEVAAILSDAALAPLFGPEGLAEVAVTAPIAELGGRRIDGRIDRLVVTPAEVLAIDIKSNRLVPDTPLDTPLGIRAQMGAYAAALGQIYPDRPVVTAILWTRSATLMRLPHETVMDALSAVTVP